MSFQYQTKVQLHDTDAAGLLFFGHQFRMVHDAYQAYLESCGFSFAEVLKRGEILIPIVHAEADFDKPLAVGDRLQIELTATKISTHSFVLHYRLVNEKQQQVGSAETVHVTIGRQSGQKVELPGPLREALEVIGS
jgi:1,4-dihydroxy-2-naphthoyl-CoA hydrolase